MEQEIRAQIEHLGNQLTSPDLGELLTYIDYTSLNTTDSERTIESFCVRLNRFLEEHPDYKVPAVCVFPHLVRNAKKVLNDGVLVACVSTGFPEGQTFGEVKVLETKLAVEAGADEVDMVINRGAFISGDTKSVAQEINKVKVACKSAKLKVILEVCDLPGASEVMEASKIAIENGADFIKTSTGKGKHGATPDSFFAMCLAVEAHFKATGKKIGLKAAGGIRSADDAWLYRSIVQRVLGDDWLTPKYFRIGASSLAASLESALFPKSDKHYL
jgi:deoxyribose-phosphate aldolase